MSGNALLILRNENELRSLPEGSVVLSAKGDWYQLVGEHGTLAEFGDDVGSNIGFLKPDDYPFELFQRGY